MLTWILRLLGAVVGWAILSPLAKFKGWAPGSIDDWETGSKGWIVWTSLAIMLADAIISLGHLAFRPVMGRLSKLGKGVQFRESKLAKLLQPRHQGYSAVNVSEHESDPSSLPVPASPLSELAPDGSYAGDLGEDFKLTPEDDAPVDQLISDKVVWVGFLLSVVFAVICIQVVFGHLVPLYAIVVAVFMALLLSIMGVRALGETDLNPVSGISKLAQLFFALIIPQSNKSSVLINLVAGAVVRLSLLLMQQSTN